MEIADLLSSLNESDIEQLKQTASALLGGMGGGREGPPDAFDSAGGIAGDRQAPGGGLDAGLIKTLTGVSGMMSRPDPRCDFLLALKPLLSDQHRDRAEQAAKMLRLMKALPILKESNILKGLF